MMEEKIKIDLDSWRENECYGSPRLILRHPTGVLYTSQCGGTFFNFPEVEGFVLMPFHARALFKMNDCKEGLCGRYRNSKKGKENFLKELDKELSKINLQKQAPAEITFVSNISANFDDVESTMENWWPVKAILSRAIPNKRVLDTKNYSFSLYGSPAINYKWKEYSGYINMGYNCD